MGVSKVLFGGETIIDLTADTVTAEVFKEGYTAHGANGELITGTFIPSQYKEPYEYDYLKGYTNSGTWIYQDSVNNHTDFYEVKENHRYFLGLGNNVGTRFRAAVLPTNPVGTTQNVTGTQIVNKNNPTARDSINFTAAINGYLCVTKDNAGTAGLKSYLVDLTPND